MSVGDVSVDIDDNYAATNDNGVYSARLDFKAKGNVVGTATLRISTPANLAASSNAPLLVTDSADINSPRKCLVINLWALITIAIMLFILVYMLKTIKSNRRRRRRRGGGRKLKM